MAASTPETASASNTVCATTLSAIRSSSAPTYWETSAIVAAVSPMAVETNIHEAGTSARRPRRRCRRHRSGPPRTYRRGCKTSAGGSRERAATRGVAVSEESPRRHVDALALGFRIRLSHKSCSYPSLARTPERTRLTVPDCRDRPAAFGRQSLGASAAGVGVSDRPRTLETILRGRRPLSALESGYRSHTGRVILYMV